MNTVNLCVDPNNGPNNEHQLRNNKNQCKYNWKSNDYKNKKNGADSINQHMGPSFGARAVSKNENVKENDIVCECNETAKLMTVKKTGPNSGKFSFVLFCSLSICKAM